RATVSRASCPPPEIFFNGSLFQTDGSEDFGNVYEVRFMGLFGGVDKKRACKIKCVNGLWFGPLCALENQVGDGGRFHSVLKSCALRPPKPNVVVHRDGRPLAVSGLTQMAHETVLSFRCAQLGMHKFVGNASVRCLNGHWSAAMPTCLVTSQQSNFSVCFAFFYFSPSSRIKCLPHRLVALLVGDYSYTRARESTLFTNKRILATPGVGLRISSIRFGGREASAPAPRWRLRHRRGVTSEPRVGVYTFPTLITRSKIAESLARERMRAARYFAEGSYWRAQSTFHSAVKKPSSPIKASHVCGAGVCPLAVIQCPEISNSNHLRASTLNRTYGIRVHFSCPLNYRLTGPPFVTCWKNATWSDTPPTCEPIRCRTPLPPANGRVLYGGRQYPGDSVQYTCNAGYVLIGESVSVCEANGTWSKAVPKCKPACEFPGQPAHARLLPSKFHYDIGEVALVACSPGYRLLGSARLRCSRDGHWSSPLPHCRRLLAVHK
ncbi:unnamed protein product, partial [Ixodes hexagonus]